MANDNTIYSSHCLSDEDIACWQEGLIPAEQVARIEGHLKLCVRCRRLVGALAAVTVQQRLEGIGPAPAGLAAQARGLLQDRGTDRILDAVVTIADGLYKAVETSGKVIFAPWLPAGVAFRGRNEVAGGTIVLEATHRDTRCRLELSQQEGGRHTASAGFRVVTLDQPLSGVQCVLYLEGNEVESQMVREGRAVFEDLLPGIYRLECSAAGRARTFLTFSLVPV